MRVLVCGGREFSDLKWLTKELDQVHQENSIKMIVHGNARGADKLSGIWAAWNKVQCCPVPAEWSRYGKRAGGIRNQKMLGYGIDLVLAFPGGSGTRDMIKRARKHGVKVVDLSQDQKELL